MKPDKDGDKAVAKEAERAQQRARQTLSHRAESTAVPRLPAQTILTSNQQTENWALEEEVSLWRCKKPTTAASEQLLALL